MEERDNPTQEERVTVEGRACRLWTADNTLQPFRPLVPQGRVRQDLRRARPARGRWRRDHDRPHTSQGSTDGGRPLKREQRHWADQRRAELHASHCLQRTGSATDLPSVARPDERCEGRTGADRRSAACQGALGR